MALYLLEGIEASKLVLATALDISGHHFRANLLA